MCLLEPDDRRELSEQVLLLYDQGPVASNNLLLQILASAHAGAELSKQLAALDYAVVEHLSQIEVGSGEGDHASVLRGLQTAMGSRQVQVYRARRFCFPARHGCVTIVHQNFAAATVDRDYNDNLKRLATNLQKHTSAGDDDEVRLARLRGNL